LGCGVIALGPLAIPIGIGAVLAGGVGGALFQNVRPSIDEASSNVNSNFEKITKSLSIPRSTFQIFQSEEVKRILRIFELEKNKNKS